LLRLCRPGVLYRLGRLPLSKTSLRRDEHPFSRCVHRLRMPNARAAHPENSSMPEKKTPPPPRWRLDAVALTLFAVGGLLAGAVGPSRPLTGGPSLLGVPGEWVAAYLVEPLGWASVVFLAGWFVLAGLLVVNRSPSRLAVRLAGWCVLTASAATAAD